MRNSLRNLVKSIAFQCTIMKWKYDFAQRDLNKSIANAKPITKDQKEYILSFWNKYLFNKWAKKSFNLKWFDVYNQTNVDGHDLRYYIPDGYYYCIIDTFFADYKRCMSLDDKNLYDLYFPDIAQPRTICRKNHGVYLDEKYNIISLEDALRLCEKNNMVIIKASVESEAGMGISFWNNNKSSIAELKSMMERIPSFIGQDIIKQNKVLSDFNDSCVNTLRLVTLLLDNKVHVVSSTCIMGGKGAKTNHLHGGGIVCGIHPNGRLRSVAFDGALNKYEKHPNGVSFGDVTIPNYEKCVSLAKELAPRLSNVTRFIGWDFTIDEQGNPILIEPNLAWAGSCQIASGPVLGDLTEEVLEYIYNSKKLFYSI